ncbi:MAG: hypothetical protein ACR2H4_05635 [Pyrinomonadaceae bacterium]
MKPQRRIEITAFRRRTTVVLRDSAEVGNTRTQSAEETGPDLVQFDLAPVGDLDQPQTGPEHSNRVGNAKDQKSI